MVIKVSGYFITDGKYAVCVRYFLVVHSQPASIRGKGRTSHPILSQARR